MYYVTLVANHRIRSRHHNFYLFNARGDVVQRVDGHGNVLHTYQYDAFGNSVFELRDYEPFSDNPFRFAGEFYDWETGEYYLRARSYNPRLGRFTQPDPFWNVGNMQSSNAAVLQSANLYVYTVNNPVRWVDPSGLVKKPSLQSALGPAEIGGGGSGRTIGGGSGGGVSVGGGTVSGGRSNTTNIVTARPAPAAQSGTGGGAGTGTATQPREVAPAASGQSGARSGATPGATTQQRAVVPAPQGGGPAPQNISPAPSTGNTSNTTTVVTSTSRAPIASQSLANTIFEQIGTDGTVRSRTFFDSHGHPFARQDFDHSHGGMRLHEHNRAFSPAGQPITPHTVIILPPGYSNIPTRIH